MVENDLPTVLANEVGYGCVLFDGGQPGPGWACVAGDEPRRIDGIDALGTGCLWLTNVPYDVMAVDGVGSNPWLRHDGYLRLRVEQIFGEWGLQDEPPDVCSGWLADLFDRVMRYAGALLPDQDWSKRTLVEEMASAWIEPEMPEEPYGEAMSRALRESIQEWTRTPVRSPKGNITIKFWRPRMTHCQNVLAVPVPVGPWKLVAGNTLPPRGERMEWLTHDVTVPVLSNIVIQQDSVSDDLALLFAFGGGARDDQGYALRRSWCTHPELVALNNLQPVEVDVAFLGSGYQQIPPPKLDADALEKLLSPIGAASWSAGLVMENLWLAAARPAAIRTRSQNKRRRAVSYRGAWLRAHDRIICFTAAGQLFQRGWLVTGYGTGAIWVSVERENIGYLLHDAFAAGLVPSLQHIKDIPDIRSFTSGVDINRWGGAGETLIEALARYSARGENLVVLDGLLDVDEEDVPGVLEGMLVMD